MFGTLAFWLDRGVDGFRLDAVTPSSRTLTSRQSAALHATRDAHGVSTQDFIYTRRLPEVHEVLRRLRAFADHRAPGAVLISEAYVDAVADLVLFYGQDDEMHLPFNFFLAQYLRSLLLYSGRRSKTWKMLAEIAGRRSY